MYLKRVSDLANYLSDSHRTSEEISKYIVLRTLSDLAPTALYMAEITTDGFLNPVAGFGFEKRQMEVWQRFPLTLNIPITEAVRNDSCVRIGSPLELLERFPDMSSILEFDNKWESLFAWPMLPFGVGLILFQKSLPENGDFEFLMRSIGAIVALNQLHNRSERREISIPKAISSKSKSAELTERQKIVHDLLLRGFTNLEISRDIGYSESLVRHETIEIYRILVVSGRKQLIADAKANEKG